MWGRCESKVHNFEDCASIASLRLDAACCDIGLGRVLFAGTGLRFGFANVVLIQDALGHQARMEDHIAQSRWIPEDQIEERIKHYTCNQPSIGSPTSNQDRVFSETSPMFRFLFSLGSDTELTGIVDEWRYGEDGRPQKICASVKGCLTGR